MKVFEEQEDSLKVGQESYNFALNNNLRLSDLKGNPILLVFWKTL
jgi:peroxiredoxin